MRRSRLKSAASAFVGTVLCVTAIFSRSSSAETPNPQSNHTPSQQTILDCVKRYTGFDESYTVEEIEPAPLSELSIPFLSSKLKDQTGIRIRLAPGKVKWRPPLNETEDRYERHISIFLDAEAKGLIAVTIRLAVRPPDIQVLPLEEQEQRLRESDTIYESFPTIAPKVSFLQALATVHVNGLVRPLMAREIDGSYLNLDSASGRWETKSRWIIITRGLPPMRMPGMPGIRATFMRSLVGPVAGEWMGAGQHGGPGL
jgi:hypothetical protein